MSKTKNVVKRDIVVNAPLEKVWDALTKPEHLNRWYTKDAEVDFRIGGYGELNHGWGVTSSGIYTEIDEMNHFVLESESGDFKTITTLQQMDNGVRVSISYQVEFSGEDGEAAKENMLFGTYQFLRNLKSVYEEDQDIRSQMWRTWIGIMHTTHSHGSKVVKVGENSPAESAGILLGDVITAIDGESVNGYDALETIINTKEINKPVLLTVRRNDQQMDVECMIVGYPVSY
ncbi:SRPBCC domain-containing protein [Ornithinibacillus salinisoli]|uniref:SRPBCC domain-containing protein n=1 Tax=Ornithinibacillus salinisoli TaxID=1848459 RepID=A0ABW4VVI2_9BACI